MHVTGRGHDTYYLNMLQHRTVALIFRHTQGEDTELYYFNLTVEIKETQTKKEKLTKLCAACVHLCPEAHLADTFILFLDKFI